MDGQKNIRLDGYKKYKSFIIEKRMIKHVDRSKQVNTTGRKQLYKALNKLSLHYTESMSNFILVEFGTEAKKVYEELLSHGVIVRYGDTWGMPEHIRISIGTHEENTILIEAICSILSKRE